MSFVDLTRRYNWIISDNNLNIVKNRGLTGIKKYWRRAGQLKIKRD